MKRRDEAASLSFNCMPGGGYFSLYARDCVCVRVCAHTKQFESILLHIGVSFPAMRLKMDGFGGTGGNAEGGQSRLCCSDRNAPVERVQTCTEMQSL